MSQPSRRGRTMSLTPDMIRILVVEADPEVSKSILGYIKASNYVGTSVSDGQTALDTLQRCAGLYSCILCDVNVPILAGVELLHKIREDKVLCDLPVIMMSATDETEEVYRCVSAGADDFILKPIRQDLISGLWQRVWRKRREREVVKNLDEERRKRLEYEQQIGTLRTQVETAIETPVSIISRTVSDLIASQSLSGEVRTALTGILSSLHSADGLYQPAFDKVLSRGDLDDQTKAWLTQELSTRGTVSESALAPEGRHPPSSPVKEPEEPLEPSTPKDRELVRMLRSFDFDVWSYREEELCDLVHEIFHDLDLMHKFHVLPATLTAFLEAVRSNYRKNPYHNFRHAFDVTQMTYWFLTTGEARALLTPLEVFALIFSALCHDIDHPGVNNNFHINLETPLALRYNDVSVLENHHASFAFGLVKTPGLNILSGLSPEEYKEFRTISVRIILATDMLSHTSIVARFQGLAPNFDASKAEQRRLLAEVILKCADISNPMRPFDLSKYWSNMIEEEWFLQGDLEAELALPISLFMDRSSSDQAKVSVNFITFMVKPLFLAIVGVLPAAQVCVESLERNHEKWSKLQSERASLSSPTDAGSAGSGGGGGAGGGSGGGGGGGLTLPTKAITGAIAEENEDE